MQKILTAFNPNTPFPTEHTADYKRYIDNATVNVTNPTQSPKYFDGLLHHHNHYMTGKDDKEELVRQNELQFVEGVNANPDGPLKYLSKERIDQVHHEVDIRLRELEESGLTREEILYDEPRRGVLLKDDPFFQLIKNSRIAREMLIKPNEEFSADRIIEKALR